MLYQVDEQTDFVYDVEGWLEDYLDELEVAGKFERLIADCEKLIGMFRWEEEKPSDLRFRVASALGELGKGEEGLAYCEGWYKEEEDNIFAATALVYARITMKDMEGAKKLVEKFIPEGTGCDDSNDIMFIAAQKLYGLTGDKKAKKRVDRLLDAYDDALRDYFMGLDGGDEDDEEEWPF